MLMAIVYGCLFAVLCCMLSKVVEIVNEHFLT